MCFFQVEVRAALENRSVPGIKKKVRLSGRFTSDEERKLLAIEKLCKYCGAGKIYGYKKFFTHKCGFLP